MSSKSTSLCLIWCKSWKFTKVFITKIRMNKAFQKKIKFNWLSNSDIMTIHLMCSSAEMQRTLDDVELRFFSDIRINKHTQTHQNIHIPTHTNTCVFQVTKWFIPYFLFLLRTCTSIFLDENPTSEFWNLIECTIEKYFKT